MSRVFRMLLAAYPREFRRAYRADMELLFAERFADARRAGTATSFVVRTGANLLATGAAERWAGIRSAQRGNLIQVRRVKMTGIGQDISYAVRLLRRQPSFSLFVILTLALGIGATTAVFSVADSVLLRPLPYEESDRLVRIYGRFDPESGFDFPQFPLSNPEFLDYKAHTRALDDIAAFTHRTVTVGGVGGDPERVGAVAVTDNLFPLLRAVPALGRGFSTADNRPGALPVVVLSDAYWRGRFAADKNILGQTVTLNGTAVNVIGVMAAGFAFPSPETRMWLQFPIDPANPGGRQSHSTQAIGRLAPGVDLSSARAELSVLMNDWKAAYPTIHTGHYLIIRPLLDAVAGDVRPALLLLLGATGFVLLIVCANVASVVLARGEARTREMAIRGALGAGRWRLVRFALVENAILAVVGGTLGFGLAAVLVRMLIAIDPESIPRVTEIAPDYRMAAFALAVSALCAGLVGLMPAIRGARVVLQSTLRESSLSATGSASRLAFRRVLVAAEVGLTVMLLLGAGLMLRSFNQLAAVDPGFRPDGLITANLALPSSTYPEATQVETFYAALLERLARTPGVDAVSAGSTMPMASGMGVWDFEVEGRPAPGPGQPAWNAAAVIALPGYFQTLGVPILRGRPFTSDDHGRSSTVTIINQALARRYFPGEDPIGKRIRVAGQTPGAWMSIVGVSGDVHTEGLQEDAPPAYHFLHSQLARIVGDTTRSLSLIVRTRPDASSAMVMQAIRTTVRELDPSLALHRMRTADAVVHDSVARPRFTTALLTIFAVIGLVLGATGIYGVLAYTVARRTQEIGIRRALGAQPSRLVKQIVTSGMWPVAVGLTVGLLASYWATQFWSAQLFRVSRADPFVYLGVAIGVALVALAATIVPVRRALRVSPLVAVRSE
jgi:putative ABC transport system permease protein